MNKNETIADIRKEAEARFRELLEKHVDSLMHIQAMQQFNHAFDRIEAARSCEAEKIERIVRDAVVDYNGMYTCAPNDEAEREVVERAETANEWLKAHGMEPEPFYYSKEETPCL